MDAFRLQEFLERHPTGVLATTRSDGRPHAAPVTFALAGPQIAIASLDGAQRIENLRAHPHASLVISQDAQAVVIIEGAARVVPPAEASATVRERFRDPSGALPPWIGAFVVVTPERVLSYADEAFEIGPSA